MSEPQKGNHADLYEIEQRVDELAAQLRECGLRTEGLFNNADAGFDAKSSGLRWRAMKSSPTSALIPVMESLPRIICSMMNFIRNDS